MNTSTLFLVFGLIFATLGVSTSSKAQTKTNVKNASYCEDIWQVFLPIKDECTCKPWREGVQQLQEGAAKVFKNYPGLTNAIGETVITALKTYTDKLISLTLCNSTILSTRSVSILEAMTLLSNAGKSASYLVNENAKATPSLVSAYTKIVSELSDNIGELTQPINDIITDLGGMFDIITKQFQNRFVEREEGVSEEKIDFKPMMRDAQLLANTIGLIVETALDDCDSATLPNDTYEALAVLIFVLNDCFLSIQGIVVSMAAVLQSESSGISDFLHSSLLSLDPFVRGVGESITSMPTDIHQSVRVLLTKVVNLLYPLDDALDNLLGPSDYDGARITVTQIKTNLLRTGPSKGHSSR